MTDAATARPAPPSPLAAAVFEQDWRQRAPMPPQLLVGFVLAALAVVLVALFTYWSSTERTRAVEQMTATLETSAQTQAVLSILKDAETGQRGYLLTGEPRYLAPFETADAALPVALRKLRNQLLGSPQQLERLAQLEAQVKLKMAELSQTVALKREGQDAKANEIVKGDQGRLAMDVIRGLLAEMQAAENQALDTKRRRWEEIATVSSYFTWGSALVLFLLILASAAMTGREHRAKTRQNWIRSGLMGLGVQLQGDPRLDQLSQAALDYMAGFLGARVGTAYVPSADGRWQPIGGYALGEAGAGAGAAAVADGQGLLGQAAQSRRLLHVRDVPPGYLPVSSSLGRTTPAELVVAPALLGQQVQAVVELGFLRSLDDSDLEFIAGAAELLAHAVRTASDRSRLEALLEETQRQSEELQAQQEELRANNEELEQQSRILQASQAQMEAQQTELEQSNAQLEEQTQQLEHQKARLEDVQRSLSERAQELAQASQYKSEFLANMSHELRTPLNSSLILAKLLADNPQGNLNGEQVKFAQTIYAAGNDLLALINDILDLAKIEAGQTVVAIEPFTLAPMLDALAAPLQPLARQKGLALTLAIEPGVPEVFDSDAQRLGQILKNLLSNALKFTAQGEVLLRVSANADDTLSFAVRDTGIGIAAEQHALIFEAFRQADGSTHRKYGGTGLGLSISRDLAHLLGGRITVQSTAGAGSVFTLVLPRTAPASAARQEPQPASPPAAALTAPLPPPEPSAAAPLPDDRGQLQPGTRTILAIEDDLRFAGILQTLAHEMGFQCLHAANAADGLAAAERYQPSAIVLDINLPDASGLSVLDQLKRTSATRHIPVHVVSVADYTQEALDRGAVGYALKPVKRDELVQALRRLEAKFTQGLRRVLVVEDDERQRESVRQLLSHGDVEIVGAATAAEAIERLRGMAFDCMVMDLNLPDLSGYELLEQMASQEDVSFPPVIVYTGRSLSAAEEQQLRRFSKSIIIKDARSPERLLDEVTLFLHQVESTLPDDRRRMLQAARDREARLDGRSVLVVEDDVRNIFALSSILEPKGLRVQIARNGREALEVLERTQAQASTRVDLVLMDIMMPEMDGYAAMREIRKRPDWLKLPIIALTAKAMKDDQEKCLAAGANDYIAKPLDVEKLLSLVRVWMPR